MTSQAPTMDRISLALARRRQQVEQQELLDEESRKLKDDLLDLLEEDVTLDPGYLVRLLAATWERLPDDLSMVGWESPSADTDDESLNEALSLGAAVGDVFAVYQAQRPRKEA